MDTRYTYKTNSKNTTVMRLFVVCFDELKKHLALTTLILMQKSLVSQKKNSKISNAEKGLNQKRRKD